MFDRVFTEGVKKLQRAGQGLVASGTVRNVANPRSGPDYPYTRPDPDEARTAKALYKAHSSDERETASIRGTSRKEAMKKATDKTKAELEDDPQDRWRDANWKPKRRPRVSRQERKAYHDTRGGDRETH